MFSIDTHAHLYLPEFDADRREVIARAEAEGIQQILLPAIDSRTHAAMVNVEKEFVICKAMMGLHPCSVTADFKNELAIIENWMEEKDFVAVGETGLDFYWDKTFVSEQYEAFHYQIELALSKNLPVVIHSRQATDECIEVIRQYQGVRGVFHCFSGTTEQAQAIMETGLFLGIGGVLTFKNAGLDKVIAETGIEQVILETDAPYLAPVPFRGKRNESSYLKYIVDKLVTVTGKNRKEILEITTQNATKLFMLS